VSDYEIKVCLIMTCVKTDQPVTWEFTKILLYVCLKIFNSGIHFSDTHKEVTAVGQTISEIYRKTGIYFDINTN